MKGKRKRGRQKKRWEDNIKEWTGMDFASSTRAAEKMSRWKGIVANSSDFIKISILSILRKFLL